MERIYFDKQIFSRLFKNEDPFYQDLLIKLLQNKDKFLYCYSHAHLLDLKNDKTQTKYQELVFMTSLVNDNYLSYNAAEKETSCYLATPPDAFQELEQENQEVSLQSFFDDFDFSGLTNEQIQEFKKAQSILQNEKIDFDFSDFDKLPSHLKEPLSKILPVDTSSLTIQEWTEYLLRVVKNMEEDQTVYKGIRNVIDKQINDGKFTIDYDNIDFNDDLKNSTLQKTFIEYVNSNLNPNGDRELSNYDFFVNAYFTLDLLGISMEPSKKVKFKNMMNDGYHSYYGAYCDYIVSDDEGFLKKTRSLYRLLGIDSKVYHIDEFIKYFNLLVAAPETPEIFFKLLRYDLKNGLSVGNKNSVKFDRTPTTIIKPNHNYLWYFNRIESFSEQGYDYILLRRQTKNYSFFKFFREYEGLINNAFKHWGDDSYAKGEFKWSEEVTELKNEQWQGRYWDFNDWTIHIEINQGIKEICLLLTIK